MAFRVAVFTLLVLAGTVLGFHGASFSADFANINNRIAVSKKTIGRIRTQHRRRTSDVFRYSFNDGHTRYPSEDKVLSNNVIADESSPTLRPSRAEAKRISTIQRVILDVTLSRVPKFLRHAFRIFSPLMLAISLFFSIPVQSSWARNGSELHSSLLDRAQSAPSSSSSSYYLRSNPTRNNPPMQTDYDEVASVIQTTRGSRKSSSDGVHRKRKRSQQRFLDERRGRNNDYSRGRGGIEKRAVKGISLSILATTVAASSFRASRRKSKTVREVTPFGIIRNQSPLGNGVSVIRVRMALGFDEDGGGNTRRDDGGGAAADDDARSLLRRLHLEEKELYARTVILASQQQQQQLGRGVDAHGRRQKALVDYSSNGEFLRGQQPRFRAHDPTHPLPLSTIFFVYLRTNNIQSRRRFFGTANT